jgi:hypothetical protein
MSETKEMKPTQNDFIELNVFEIEESIKKDGKYEKDGIMLRKWEGEENSNHYITQINRENVTFVGVLNDNFQREGYGFNDFANGDKFFGYYRGDKRNTHGIYFWEPDRVDGILKKEVYYGFWKNNKKDNHGCYLWVEEEQGNKDFEKTNFDTFIGLIDEDKYKRGTYLSKKEDNYYLYYGEFGENGKKTDNNAMFYSSTDRLIKGKIEDDEFKEGHIAIFDSETGDLTDLMFCTFGQKASVNSLKMEKDLDQELVKKIKEEMITFRNVILEEDYFGNVYSKYNEVKDFIKAHMNTLETLDDPEKYPEIISLCSGYNKLNIYADIEKKVYGRKV